MANVPEARAAYLQCLAALGAANEKQGEILASENQDWDAYDAAAVAAGKARDAADAAERVFRAALLDSPAVHALLATLETETADMKKSVERLKATAKTLNELAGIADAVTTTLKAILKFV